MQLGLVLAALLPLASLGTAHAESENPCGEAHPCAGDDAAVPASAGPLESTAAGEDRSLVTPSGSIALSVAVGVNLGAENVGNPVAIAPDVRYGVMDKLDVGLYHSTYGTSGFWNQEGGGLCFTGDACAELYDGPTALLANYSLGEGALSMAVSGGVIFTGISSDSLLIDVKAGMKLSYVVSEKIGLSAEPALFVSATEREPETRDLLSVPLALMYMVNATVHAGVQTGIAGPLEGFGDGYKVPLSIASLVQIDGKLGVGGAFGFGNLFGKGGTADERNLSLFARYAL